MEVWAALWEFEEVSNKGFGFGWLVGTANGTSARGWFGTGCIDFANTAIFFLLLLISVQYYKIHFKKMVVQDKCLIEEKEKRINEGRNKGKYICIYTYLYKKNVVFKVLFEYLRCKLPFFFSWGFTFHLIRFSNYHSVFFNLKNDIWRTWFITYSINIYLIASGTSKYETLNLYKKSLRAQILAHKIFSKRMKETMNHFWPFQWKI